VVDRGEIHALMGPNGSGKSTLAAVLMGHPAYRVTAGIIMLDGEDIAEWKADERGRAGMFLGFQYPEEIPGVSVVNFLRTALTNRTGVDYTVLELRLKVMDAMRGLGMDPSFADRYLNEGFSGGERKRNEILQLTVLEPELAILDETDSGLDIDALKTVAEGVARMASDQRGFLVITHYQRLLEYLEPTHVHVFADGRIVESGGPDLARRVEEEGYDKFRSASVAR
jgi:Fe-S cluster assembly ATP-binding protein